MNEVCRLYLLQQEGGCVLCSAVTHNTQMRQEGRELRDSEGGRLRIGCMQSPWRTMSRHMARV